MSKKFKWFFEASKVSEPKWVKDEDTWAKAKKAAKKAAPDNLYALNTYLYKKMGGEITKAKEADKTGVRTKYWFYGTEAFFPKNLEVKPELVDELKKPNPADEQAQKLLNENPQMPAATLLNSLKAQGIELVDQKANIEATGTSTNAAVLRQQESNPLRIFSQASFKENAGDRNKGIGPIRFKVALIQEGLGNLGDAFFYSKEAIRSGIQAFEGKKCFADHPSRSEEHDRPERSVRDIIGYFQDVAVEENDDQSLRLVATLVMPPDPPFEWARSLVRNAALYNEKYPDQNLVGLSINASGDAAEIPYDDFIREYDLPESCKPKLMKAREQGMQGVKVVSSIHDAISCDLVTEPGAKGKVLEILESEPGKEMKMKAKQNEKKSKIEAEEEKKMMMAEEEEEKVKASEDEAKQADGVEPKDEEHSDEEQDKKLILDMIKKHMGDEGEMEMEAEEAAMGAYEAYKEMGESEDEAMKCAAKAMKLAKHMAAKSQCAESEEEEKKEAEEALPMKKKEREIKLEARIALLERELKKRELKETLDSKLKESGLGRAETDKLRKLIGEPKSEADIVKTITIFKEAFSARGESSEKGSFFINPVKTVAVAKKSKVSFSDC
jgi:hypothetical protein